MITLILATDMARHAEIMDSFKEKMENFDYSNKEHMTLVSGLFFLLWGLMGEPHPPAQTGDQETKGKCIPSPGVRYQQHQFSKSQCLAGKAPEPPVGPPLLVKGIPFPSFHLLRI